MYNLIEKFDEYFNKIEESLNSSVDINWIGKDKNYIGHFEISGEKYRIEYLLQIGNNYSYSFSIYKDNRWTYDISNSGNPLSVLSTVVKGIEYLFNETKPDSIIFTAIDDNQTRKSLYEKYCNDFCIKNDYRLSNRGNDKMMMFVLFDDKLDIDKKDLIFQSAKKIIEIGK
jgi:hypothetical protein